MTESYAEKHMNEDEKAEAAVPANDTDARIKELETQLAEMKNEALRYLADAENTRRRATKEKEDIGKYAVSKFARDLLDVADNMQRALQSVKPEMFDGNPAIKNLFVGIEATDRQLTSVFERYGIQKVEPLGQPFDPNLHQVVTEVDAPDKAPGTVVQVLQTGYTLQGRLLREAMVAVAKGGAAPQSVDQKI